MNSEFAALQAAALLSFTIDLYERGRTYDALRMFALAKPYINVSSSANIGVAVAAVEDIVHGQISTIDARELLNEIIFDEIREHHR